MDFLSVRRLMTLVTQLHSIILCARALSGERPTEKPELTSLDLPKPCCYNGGLCVLGSFCHCPDDFYGRHCEFKLGRKPCGLVPHASWVKAGCNLCQCTDGQMTCFPRAFHGCDHVPMKEEINPFDYEMEIFPRDSKTRRDQEDYDYYDARSGSSMCFQITRHSCLVWIFLIMWRLLS